MAGVVGEIGKSRTWVVTGAVGGIHDPSPERGNSPVTRLLGAGHQNIAGTLATDDHPARGATFARPRSIPAEDAWAPLPGL